MSGDALKTAPEGAGDRQAIVVLGGSNAADGTLSARAIERCRRAFEEYSRRPGAKIVTTGGRGAHFNTASQPHGVYLRRFLIRHGMPETAFLGVIESRNTIEDARLTRDVVREHGLEHLTVVTSDFHMPRARWIFERTFPSLRLTFVASRTHASESEMAALRFRERLALQRVQAAWPDLPG